MRRREIVLLVICGLLSLAVFYLLTLDLWGLSVWGKTIDYSRFGTWSNALSGIGTTTALMVALLSLLSQRSIYRQSESRRVLDEETSLFLWLTFKEIRDPNDVLVKRIWDIKIQNSTSSPIYRWKITFNSKANHLCNYLKRPLLPGENTFNLPFFDDTEPTQVPESMLVFEDRSGRVWTRSVRGILTEGPIEELNCEDTPKAK